MLGSKRVADENKKSREFVAMQSDCSIYVMFIREGDEDEVPFKEGNTYSVYDLCKFLEAEPCCCVKVCDINSTECVFDLVANENGNQYYPMSFVFAKKFEALAL